MEKMCVMESARYYRSRLVNEYLEDSRTELMFLPPYSPKLNLIERYWKYFKKISICNRYYESFAEFKKACERFFENTDEHKSALHSLLSENFQIINGEMGYS